MTVSHMFIQDVPAVGVPDLDHVNRVNTFKTLKYQQKLRENLWKRFIDEYLGLLVQWQRKNKGPGGVKVGDVVLVGYNNKKRLNWPLGLGVFLFSGSDSCVQVVRVKTAIGELTRPVQHVFPLVISQWEPQLCGHDAKNPLTDLQFGTQASWR